MYRLYLIKEPNEPETFFVDERRVLPLRDLWEESFLLIAEEFCFANDVDAKVYVTCEKEKEELAQQIAVLDTYQCNNWYFWGDLSELAHAKAEIEAQIAVIASYQTLLPVKASNPQFAAVSKFPSCDTD